tara:strand:- start:404 stop:1762 length:1359 start_codon:yes stop_codon:yes gene_type:complete
MPGIDPPITEVERNSATHVRKMICTDVDANNNKWWTGWALSDGTFVSEYGRVGESFKTDRKPFGDVDRAKKEVEKARTKRLNYKPPKKPYVDLQVIQFVGDPPARGSVQSSAQLKTTAVKQIDMGGNPELHKLIRWLADVNIHTIMSHTNIAYDTSSGTFSTPLGIVTADAIVEARSLLDTIAKFVSKRSFDAEPMKVAIGQYMQFIPQDIGRGRGWHKALFGPSDAVQKQNDILDSLDASIQAVMADNTKTTTKKTENKLFGVKLDIVSDGKIIDQVRKQFRGSRGNHYDVATYDVKKVYAIEISTVKAAFDKHGRLVGNIMRLWHGSSAANLLSILKSGLIIPPSSSSHVTGRAFGEGCYFSSQSTKSLRYATGAWGGKTSNRVFMFLADVSMGNAYTPRGYTGMSRLPAGFDSCWAKSSISGVQNPEMIVYKTNQVNLVYLVEFSRHGK